jgi:ribosome-binding protein aMBF1 (putative translation factor)
VYVFHSVSGQGYGGNTIGPDAHGLPAPGRLARRDADHMPNDADRAGTPAGVFGAELRYYRSRAGLSQKDLAARAIVSHDVISKIETGERPPAEDFPARLDAIPELDTGGALTRL